LCRSHCARRFRPLTAFRFLRRRVRAQVARARRAIHSASFHLLQRIQRALRRLKFQFRIFPAARSSAARGCVAVAASAPLPDPTRSPAQRPALQSGLIRHALPGHQRNLPSCSTRFFRSSYEFRNSCIDTVAIINKACVAQAVSLRRKLTVCATRISFS